MLGKDHVPATSNEVVIDRPAIRQLRFGRSTRDRLSPCEDCAFSRRIQIAHGAEVKALDAGIFAIRTLCDKLDVDVP